MKNKISSYFANFKFLGGFTLLEMLVVIGIIAVLVSMGFVSFSSAQKKARDSRRKLDLSNVKNAMEQYYSLCYSSYPAAAGGKVPASIITTLATPCTLATTIMATTPTDPKTGGTYDYNAGATPPSICATNGATNLMESETAVFCVYLQQ